MTFQGLRAYRIHPENYPTDAIEWRVFRDLLRYDLGFIVRVLPPGSPLLVAFPILRTATGDLGGNGPTFGRWGSMLIALNETTQGEFDAMHTTCTRHPERWVTYLHHPPNYSALYEHSLAEFLRPRVESFDQVREAFEAVALGVCPPR